MKKQPFEKIFEIEKCTPGFQTIDFSLEEKGLAILWLKRWIDGHPDQPIVKNIGIMYSFDDLFELFLDGALTGIAYSGEVLHRRGWDKG